MDGAAKPAGMNTDEDGIFPPDLNDDAASRVSDSLLALQLLLSDGHQNSSGWRSRPGDGAGHLSFPRCQGSGSVVGVQSLPIMVLHFRHPDRVADLECIRDLVLLVAIRSRDGVAQLFEHKILQLGEPELGGF